jgi:hypothetical protein
MLVPGDNGTVEEGCGRGSAAAAAAAGLLQSCASAPTCLGGWQKRLWCKQHVQQQPQLTFSAICLLLPLLLLLLLLQGS